ncbi:MAG: GGDEF domain-containing protein [Bacterioplanes sp.]|nr:GGDEF domain-containing protein [Bacterioplanes sp.]
MGETERDQIHALTTILNNLDALVYVSDMNTHELLFLNDYGVERWGEPKQRKCWQVIQSNQTSPCEFCTNRLLLDEQGQPNGIHVWEFQNTANGHWYQCRDQAIEWIDGRIVRLEVATDISDRKQLEQDLIAARQHAEYLADTDPLTQLNNRRAFFTLAQQVINESKRQPKPLSIMMLDLDHFKDINDQYGHAAGDTVLTYFADVCRQSIRESDIVARIGGEEFVVFMPNTTRDQALTLAERLRNNIDQCRIPFQQHTIQTTASIGIADSPDGNVELDALLSRADHQLYQAKDKGRNQTC